MTFFNDLIMITEGSNTNKGCSLILHIRFATSASPCWCLSGQQKVTLGMETDICFVRSCSFNLITFKGIFFFDKPKSDHFSSR